MEGPRMKSLIKNVSVIWTKDKGYLPEYLAYCAFKGLVVLLALPIYVVFTVCQWIVEQSDKMTDVVAWPFRRLINMVDAWHDNLVARFNKRIGIE